MSKSQTNPTYGITLNYIKNNQLAVSDCLLH